MGIVGMMISLTNTSAFYMKVTLPIFASYTNKIEYMLGIKISIFFLKQMKNLYLLVGKEVRKVLCELLALVLFSIAEGGEFWRGNKPVMRGRKITRRNETSQNKAPNLACLCSRTRMLWHACFLYYSPSTSVSPNSILINPCFIETNLFYLCYILWIMNNLKQICCM